MLKQRKSLGRLFSLPVVAAAILAAAVLPPAASADSDAARNAGSPAVNGGSGAGEEETAFAAWKEALRQEALGLGISLATLDKALTPAQPIPKVIEYDRRQPEFTQTFWRYVDLRVNEARIARGQEMLKTHAALLDRIWRKYRVPPRFLVAFWDSRAITARISAVIQSSTHW